MPFKARSQRSDDKATPVFVEGGAVAVRVRVGVAVRVRVGVASVVDLAAKTTGKCTRLFVEVGVGFVCARTGVGEDGLLSSKPASMAQKTRKIMTLRQDLVY
jgi:hypothetical protein